MTRRPGIRNARVRILVGVGLIVLVLVLGLAGASRPAPDSATPSSPSITHPSATPSAAASPRSTATLTDAPTPNDARPALRKSIVEGGIRITRISTGARHAYSRILPWNSDGSRLLLGFAPSKGRMLEGRTYADLGPFEPVPDALWSNRDPNLIYGSEGNALVRQDATTGAVTTIHTFAGPVSIGSGEGGISDDDRYLCLTAAGRLIVWDLDSNAAVGDIPAPSGLDNAQISRLGTWVVVIAGDDTRVYPRDLSSSRVLYSLANHGDNALVGGREVFVANNAPNVVSFDLATGAGTTLLTGSAFEYGHVSGRGPRPILSNYDTVITAGRPGHDQIVAVNPDGSVSPFGFAHHSGSDYASQPQAVSSRDGERVLFASDWGGSINAYVAEVVPVP
jgi:hypothetical protein